MPEEPAPYTPADVEALIKEARRLRKLSLNLMEIASEIDLALLIVPPAGKTEAE